MHGSRLGVDLDSLPVRDVRPPTAQLVHRDQRVIGDVRDRKPDHIEVRDQREQRPFAGSACDEVSDRIGLDVGNVADRLPHHVESQVLVPRRAVSAQKRFEECRDRHDRRSLGPP